MNKPETTPEKQVAHASAGQMLRAAREARDVQLAALSVTLKVSVRQLEALEADRHDAFKGMAFVRALAKSVCRQLNIESGPVLAALPQMSAPQAIEPAAIEMPRTTLRTPPRSASGKGLSRQVLVLSALMLLGVAALMWWPSSVRQASEDQTDPSQVAVPLGQSSNLEQTPVQAASAEASASMPDVSSASTTKTSEAPATPAAVNNASAPVPAASAASRPSAAVATALDESLLIRVQADMWVEVRDGRGPMLVKRTVKAGETLQLSPSAPFFVYVGKADAAQLRWQGQPLDLKPHTLNNEARLQIKP